MIEEWRPVVGYEAHYAVSNFGRVKSHDRYSDHGPSGIQLHRGKMLKLRPDGKGYLTVCLCVEAIRKSTHVHQIVAKAFLGLPPYQSAPVNHLDFDGSNNCLTNLEWSDAKANIQHSHRAKHFCPVANPNHRRKLTPEQVQAIRDQYASGDTQLVISRRFGVSRSYISMLAAKLKWVNL